jgi:hypothetical protein
MAIGEPVAKIMKTKMLKIAVASENGMVTEQHCEGFMIFDTENNQIMLLTPGIGLDSYLTFLLIMISGYGAEARR